MEGIILKALSGFYYVDDGQTVIPCRGRGKLRHAKVTPLVGDRVEFTPLSDGQGALEAVRAIVGELADHGPTQEELSRARDQAQANILMGMESVQARMSHLGSSALLYGRVRETEELLDLYDAVTREQLRDLAGALFRMETASLSAVGRVGSSADYAAWLGR